MNNQYNSMESAKSVENKGCKVCYLSAACLADGPVPDFEVAAVSGIFNIWG